MAWTDAARAAALATRQANAAKNAKQKPQNLPVLAKKSAMEVRAANRTANGQLKPGPITKPFTSGGARAAAVVRNRLIHDAGRPAREAAAHQRQLEAALSRGGRMAGAGLLGAVLGLAGTLGKAATANLRGRR